MVRRFAFGRLIVGFTLLLCLHLSTKAASTSSDVVLQACSAKPCTPQTPNSYTHRTLYEPQIAVGTSHQFLIYSAISDPQCLIAQPQAPQTVTHRIVLRGTTSVEVDPAAEQELHVPSANSDNGPNDYFECSNNTLDT